MCDRNRVLIYELLHQSGISVGTEKYREFSIFLNDPANTNYLQLFFILCSGYFSFAEAYERLTDMIKELEFQQNNYSYSQLFMLNKEWYEFFKENAYPTGQRRRELDIRRGVDKSYVDDIIILNQKLGLPLDDSIHWITHLKIKMIVSENDHIKDIIDHKYNKDEPI